VPWTFPDKSTQTESRGTQNACPGCGQAQGHLQKLEVRWAALLPASPAAPSRARPSTPRSDRAGGLTPAWNTDPPRSQVTTQVRLEETDW